MTKAECIIEDLGFERRPAFDMQEEKHDGSLYTVRVWKMQNELGNWDIHCDSYYGRSVVYCGGIRYGDYEYRYEQIPALVGENG